MKEEFPGVEIAVKGITRRNGSERGEFDTMREGIEAAGVIPVAFSVSRYLNTTDYFLGSSSDSIRGNLSFTQEDATGGESPYRKRLR